MTYIRVVEPSDAPQPSQAVILVRRLLRREFDRLSDTVLEFQCLGPSPMHADFVLVPASAAAWEEPWALNVVQRRERGYDDYLVLYNRDRFADPEEAFQALMHDLGSEADVFYYSQQVSVARGRQWAALRNLSETLIQVEERVGMRGWAKRQWSTGRLIRETAVALARYDASTALNRLSVMQDFSNTYRADVQPLIKDMVESECKEESPYPVRDIRDLVQLFETRRLSGTAVTAAIIAAVVGGTVAALVTLIAN